MSSNFFIICSFLMLNNLSSNEFLIPQTEQIGIEQVADGKLDPLFFELIKPFYDQPIDVPQGELKILQELFPQLFWNISFSIDSLQKYAPWDQPAIIQFFQDYPLLAQFEPILRFDIKPVDFRAKAVFSIRNNSAFRTFSHGANLSVCFSESFKMDTRITFDNDYARWNRRVLYFEPSEKCSLQIGNFGSFFDKGLFYGFFHSADATGNQKINNWLYGSSKTWNGVKIRIGEAGRGVLSRLSTVAFFHKRETEAAGMTIFNVRVNDYISFNSGMSLLRLSKLPESSGHHYAHWGVKVKIQRLNMEIQSGLDMEKPGSVPLIVESRYNLNRSGLDFIFAFLPGDFFAPCSYMVQRIGSKNLENTNPVSFWSIQSIHHPCRWLSLTPSLNLVLKNHNSEEVCFKLSAISSARNFMFKITYRWMPACGLSDTTGNFLHQIVDFCLSPGITIRGEIELDFQKEYPNSINTFLSTKLNIFPAISLRPSICFSQTAGKSRSLLYGLEHLLTLHDKTCTQLKIEVPFSSVTKGENLSVEAKTSFLF